MCQSYEVPYIAVRSLSDFLDNKGENDDRNRQVTAAAHASAATKDLIQRFTGQSSANTIRSNQMNDEEPHSPKETALAGIGADPVTSIAGSGVSDLQDLKKIARRPVRYRGQSLKLLVTITSECRPVEIHEAKALSLEYGDAVVSDIAILEPQTQDLVVKPPNRLYASGDDGDWLEQAQINTQYSVEVYLGCGSTLVPESMSLFRHWPLSDHLRAADEKLTEKWFKGLILISAKSADICAKSEVTNPSES